MNIRFAAASALLGLILVSGCSRSEDQPLSSEYAPVMALRGTAKQEILAIARLLSRDPGMAIDFSEVSGEYCLNLGNMNMIHFSNQPDKTSEDIVYILNAKPFLKMGLQTDKMKPLPEEKGGMVPNQWYFYSGKTVEPHHGRRLGVPLLMMAIDVE